MDRRSQPDSSEKTPNNETDDTSGSLSAHFDDQTVSNHGNQECPEAMSICEEISSQSPSLKAQLSEALLTIRAKDDLVKQHARVAEEAVSGWERAENEVLALKRLNDALSQEKLVLDERVGHLDGALKQCLRELRQARDEQQDNISDAVAKKNSEWESKTFELESKLTELQSELEIARANANTTLPAADACSKLEAMEKENSILMLQLLSQDQELDRRATERDLSIQTAENTSKLYIDSINKVAKLEAECRRLKSVARKAGVLSNNHSMIESSACAESFTDSQSDHGERILYIDNDMCKTSVPEPMDGELCGTNLSSVTDQKHHMNGTIVGSIIGPSVDIDLMDDFLEMERLAAACPEAQSGNVLDAENALQYEEESVDKMSLKIALDKCQSELKLSKEHLKRTEEKLIDMEKQLTLAKEEKTEISKELADSVIKLGNLTKLLCEAEKKTERFHIQLNEAIAAKNELAMQLDDARRGRAEGQSYIKVKDLELSTLNEEVERQRKVSEQAAANCNALEVEISKLKSDRDSQTSALDEEIRIIRMQLEDTKMKKVEAEKQVSEMGIKMQTLKSSISNLEKQVEKERQFSREAATKCGKLEAEISRMQQDSQFQKPAILAEFRLTQEKELEAAASNFAECQKTIASLTRQLKSLAAFDNLLIDSE